MKLYSFFNSPASYRVRIALTLKGINYQTEGVNIRIGQQNELAYRRMNPVGLVPTLLTDEGESLGQSLALQQAPAVNIIAVAHTEQHHVVGIYGSLVQ